MFGRKAVIPIEIDVEKKEGDKLLNEYLQTTSVSYNSILFKTVQSIMCFVYRITLLQV